jgi:hypothetical protein
MTKEKSESQKKVAVPAHIFEQMIRGLMAGGDGTEHWKDELLHWSFTSAQLDQLIGDLKKGSEGKGGDTASKEIIDFIETKIKNRKD